MTMKKQYSPEFKAQIVKEILNIHIKIQKSSGMRPHLKEIEKNAGRGKCTCVQQPFHHSVSQASTIESKDELLHIRLFMLFSSMVGTIDELFQVTDERIHPLKDLVCLLVARRGG